MEGGAKIADISPPPYLHFLPKYAHLEIDHLKKTSKNGLKTECPYTKYAHLEIGHRKKRVKMCFKNGISLPKYALLEWGGN